MDGSRVRGLPPRATAVLGAAVLLAGCGWGGGHGGTGRADADTAGRQSASVPAHSRAVPGDGGERPEGYGKTVVAVLPSVVQITTGDTLGSGVVYDHRGHIVTNAHVVGDADTFEVTLATGRGSHPAKLVASYPAQDLAVIRLDSVPRGLKPAAFADSSKVEVGQIVLAMGSPLGLSSSVTQGIVSAVGRTVDAGSAEDGTGTGSPMSDLVQTSAPINPGNSGGALVNLDDQVIGVPTLAARDPELGDAAAGIGFAIPSSTVTHIADQIIKNGEVTSSGKAALGITARTVLGDDYEPSGVAVVSVSDDGPAADAGIATGDIITAVDGTPIVSMTSLSRALADHQPGDSATVTYERHGRSRTARVTLGEL
ncbi:S1C family serine protease [Streptomyces sp. XD-27]|uniref:S1C family serine protease n=1 Tax=Streptomyces sp. XD-27 TaxID=3062779 RepID=UPI0026F4631F|nr:trypsin-like peptidase domain-containing protein [Streptomyces sp. XD-27]WKX69900.1 trypsin-like peptidase domain-containing protein [Streptomyces sp. XD-27]